MVWFFQVLISWPNLIGLGMGGMITTNDIDNYAAYNFLYLFYQRKNFYPYCVIIKLYLAIKIGRRNHLQACLQV
jgi:hypothetical protein